MIGSGNIYIFYETENFISARYVHTYICMYNTYRYWWYVGYGRYHTSTIDRPVPFLPSGL